MGYVHSGRERFKRLIASLLAALAMSLVLTAATSARTQVSEIDFHVFYESAQAWRTGRDLYATAAEYPNLNPPHFVVAFAVLTWWSERAAMDLLLAGNFLAFLAVGALLWRELPLPRSFTGVATGIAAAGFCVGLLFGLEEGHPVGLLALCLTGGWAAHRRGRLVAAGVLIGALCSIKPFFAAILLVPLVGRQWRMAGAALATGGLLVAGGLALAGPSSFARWLETGGQVTWFHHPLNASVAGLISRAGLGWMPWAASVAVLLLLTVIALRRATSLDEGWLSAGLLALLVSPLGWVYYVPLLAGPIVAVALRQPLLLAASAGLVWPVPAIMTLSSGQGLAAATVCSITTWSLLAMWAATLPLLFEPAPRLAPDRRLIA